MRQRRAGTWLQPLLFADEAEEISVPEELRQEVVTALAQVLLSAVMDRSETEGEGVGHESEDPT